MFRLSSELSRLSYRLLVITLVLAGCSDRQLTTEPPDRRLLTGAATPKFWETNAAVDWNAVARGLAATNGSTPFQAIRGYALVSVAQYQAVIAAEKASERGTHPSVHAAIGAASVVALIPISTLAPRPRWKIGSTRCSLWGNGPAIDTQTPRPAKQWGGPSPRWWWHGLRPTTFLRLGPARSRPGRVSGSAAHLQ